MVTITYDALNDLTHAVGEEIEKVTGLRKDTILDLIALNATLTEYLDRYGVQYEDEIVVTIIGGVGWPGWTPPA